MKIFLQHCLTKNFIVVVVCFSFFLSNVKAQQWIALGPSDSTQFPNCGNEYRSVIVDGQGVMYVAYLARPDFSSSSELLVSKYQNGNWQQIGGVVGYLRDDDGYCLAIDGNRNLYVAYTSSQSGVGGDYSFVKVFDGNNWALVGNSMQGELIDFHSLAINKNGNLFLAGFSDESFAPIIQEYDGSKWVLFGSFSFWWNQGVRVESRDYADKISIILDHDGMPDVCLRDKDDYEKLMLFRFDSNSSNHGYWDKVGNGLPDSAIFFSMAYDQSGVLYLAFDHFRNNNYLTRVKKLVNNNWLAVGEVDSTLNDAFNPRIAFTSTNTAYFAYLKYGRNTSTPVLKKLNGNSWVTVDDTAWQSADFLDLIVDNKDKPVIFGTSQMETFFVMRFDKNQWNELNPYGIGNSPDYKYNGYHTLFIDRNLIPYFSVFNAHLNKSEVLGFSDSAWREVGQLSDSRKLITEDSSGRLYASSIVGRNDTSYNLQVTRFNGTHWVQVGNIISTNTYFSNYFFLIGKADNRLYISYTDAKDARIHIWLYKDTEWTELAQSPPFQDDGLNVFSLVMNSKEKIYAYTDAYDKVLTFDGKKWTNLAQAKISQLGIQFGELGIDALDSLYVAGNEGNAGTVFKWNGTNWRVIGSRGFAYGYDPFPWEGGFRINGLTPYITVLDKASGQARLMRFDGQSWEFLSDSSATDNCTYSMDYGFDRKGNVYEVYQELGGAFAWKIKDNSFILSGIKPRNPHGENAILISPNPNNGNFTLSVDSDNGLSLKNIILEIYNEEGILLTTINPNFINTQLKQNIDLSNFPAGVYYVGIKNQSMNQFKKFIIW